MKTIRNGSKGEDVKALQRRLGLAADGVFGAKTEEAVKSFQKSSGLTVDGIVGAATWAALGIAPTAAQTRIPGLAIADDFLSPSQYWHDRAYANDYIVLHHTAGWDDPHQVIASWNSDARGRIATEFVVGGQRSTDGRNVFDGKVVKAFPDGGAASHIGDSGLAGYSKKAVGIECCNMGHVANGKTYQGSSILPAQIVTLRTPFRGYAQFHRYSDKQLESLRKLLLFIADRDSIDLHKGLYEWIKKQGAGAFGFQSDAYYGRAKGVVTHANIRKDKEDMFPQPELMDMILTL